MTEYKCFRCCYITKFRSSMVKHFNKKNKCEKDVKSLKYSDEEIFRLSFIPLSEIDKPCVKTNIEFQTIDPLNIRIKKTKEELLEEMNNIYNNHSKKCTFCHKSFDKIKDLRKHVISECDEIEIINSHSNNIVNSNNNNNNNNITINTINIITNEQIQKPDLISFDKAWDTSHLNYETKLQLFLCTVKFTKTLEYILKNDVNLNVLIDKDSKFGFTYKDTEEKIHKMKISDIIDESILKVYNHLNDFSKEIIKNDNFTINNDIIKNEKDITKKKYKDFFDDKSIKKNVEDYFTNIFISMNEKTKDKFKNMNIDINRDEANGF